MSSYCESLLLQIVSEHFVGVELLHAGFHMFVKLHCSLAIRCVYILCTVLLAYIQANFSELGRHRLDSLGDDTLYFAVFFDVQVLKRLTQTTRQFPLVS